MTSTPESTRFSIKVYLLMAIAIQADYPDSWRGGDLEEGKEGGRGRGKEGEKGGRVEGGRSYSHIN